MLTETRRRQMQSLAEDWDPRVSVSAPASPATYGGTPHGRASVDPKDGIGAEKLDQLLVGLGLRRKSKKNKRKER